MFGKHFELNENTISIVEEIGRHMPGGFFIYKAEKPEELLYANRAVFDIFGCHDLEEFKELTGYTFKGMLHPEDYKTISESINEQIGANEDNIDYVEYRIIRRDGAVRWVDDYGHYTDTEAYGGVFYVFISDITEKREQMKSDLAVRNAVIEALSESYHTVWLINDVESESFSLYRGDVAGNTTHAAPIKDALSRMKYSQAKEYYINTTVAPEDRERLQKELTIESIVGHFADKPQWNVNYLRIMDDGSLRYFRIEFAKVNLPDGKIGVVCGFKDVDDEFRKVLEGEQQEIQQKNMITALASDYWSVYYIELDTDEGICYQSHEDVENGFKVGEKFHYLESVTAYADKYITEDYREEFMKFIQPDSIRNGLKEQRVISYRYMVRRHGKESYEMVRFAGVRHPEDRDDHYVHAVGACLTDVDAETRSTLEQSRALSEALSAAEEANKAKTAFLSNMSHEIRTPMNAIIGLDNIALSDPTISDKTREFLENINTSAQHLLNIINDILDMSRIESGRMTLKNEEFSFSKTLEQINTIINGQCRDKGIKYDCRIIGNIKDYYIGDHMKLRQIMINILGNAVKFTPEGGTVVFTIDEIANFNGKSTLRFVMSDTGIGMSKDYLPKIFDAFSQEYSSSTSKYGSTGLGMSITKNLVEMMNGDIDVESEKGKGTTFTVTVTLVDSERKAEQKNDAQSGITKELHDRRILLAEDVGVNAEIMLMLLSMKGIKTELAENGRVAVELFAKHEPGYFDAILMDMRMPVMDGLEATKTIRALERKDAKTIPIIALTANAFDEDVQRSMQAGLNAHLSKPVQPEALFETLKSLIK